MVQPTSGPSKTPSSEVRDFQLQPELTQGTLITHLRDGVHREANELLRLQRETNNTMVDVGVGGIGIEANLGNLLDLQSFFQLAVVSGAAWAIDPRLALVTIGLAVLFQLTKSLGAQALQELVQRMGTPETKKNTTEVAQGILDKGIEDRKIPFVIIDPIEREIVTDPVAFSNDTSDRKSVV